ncbi:MAG: glycosyltransferase [Thermodesulfobacteriota bacterium]|nr:MAG: glycosyltransferase [Thermodesulfobacteriota bacterium]
MESNAVFPSVSVVVPTLNSGKTLDECLKSISGQDWPADMLEIVIADGGSTDSTLDIVRLSASKSPFDVRVVRNPLKTGEAGKAVGIKEARGELIAFIDSDNVLPDRGWLNRMAEPFADPDVVGAEPLEYACRAGDGFITRYCSHLGMNDPFCLFAGNYDRYSAVTGRWTEMPYRAEDKGGWFKLELDPARYPTMGANGFIVRKRALEGAGEYFFDIDMVRGLLKKNPGSRLAKVRTGIVHIFSGDTRTFIRKQMRRIRDFRHYERLGMREYPWKGVGRHAVARFVFSCLTVLPLISQAARGYCRKPDIAWLFHPVACWLTLIVYGLGSLPFFTGEFKREGWGNN